MPAAFAGSFNSSFNWNYQTVPQPKVNNRRIYQPRGKVLGGTGTINAMIYNRGHKQDYDLWSVMGAEGYDWDSLLPYCE
jgi:choline dehydrogenase